MDTTNITITEQEAINEFYAQYGNDVHATDTNGQTLLHRATAFENIDIVKSLVFHGADVNARNKQGWSPLHYATLYNRSIEIIKFLTLHGADINIKDEPPTAKAVGFLV